MPDLAMPDPLHPAVVHVPVALAMLMPVIAAGIWIAVARGWFPLRTWVIVILLQGVLVGAGWAAIQTGEDEEERVEEVVSHDAIHEHQEAGERTVTVAAGVFVLALLGLAVGGSGGALLRGLTLAGMLAVLVLAAETGHLGGRLVYHHGAADAYVPSSGGAPADDHDGDEHEDEHEHD